MTDDQSIDGTGREVEQLRLTDDGLETPKHLVGRTGRVRVEKPTIEMTFTYKGDGVQEYSELLTFLPSESGNGDVPKDHARIEGTLYEIVDDRTVQECPECGSDSVSIDPPHKCYGCDVVVDGLDGGQSVETDTDKEVSDR